MDIIQEFESKLKIMGGEKVYSGREIMKTFGYDKWERFIGAINRAKQEISDEKKQEENFMFVINKSTGGRPKEDVFLTLGACYLVLKKCDYRKENVKILLSYLEDLLKEKKQQKKNQYWSFEKIFLVFVGVFVVFSTFWYVKNYISFLNITQSQKYDFYDKKALEKQEKIDQEKIVQMEEKIQEGIKNNVQIEKTFSQQLSEYIKQGGEPFFEISKNINYRNQFTQSLTGENLVSAYFDFGNQGFYRESCSLLTKKDCLSSSKSNLKDFGKFWSKTKQGYQILNLYKSEKTPLDGKNVYCVTYQYNLKYDTSQYPIIETFNYTTQNIDGFEQISGRFCEAIQKGGKNLKCPYVLKNYYCN